MPKASATKGGNVNSKIFLDADTVLDMAIATRRGHKGTLGLLDTIERLSVHACVCSSDIPAICSELSAYMGPEDAVLYLKALTEAFDVVNVDEAACRQALEECEDGNVASAITLVCAERAKADYIVTSNSKAFKKSSIKTIEPARYVQLVE